MTCLSIVREAARRLAAFPVPNAVVTNSDIQIVQILGLLNEEGRYLSTRHDWQALETEAAFTTVATESQGTMSALAPNYRFIKNNTIWNRTQQRPLYGPLSARQWQYQKGSNFNGPWSQYRIVGDTLKFVPAPTAGESCYFEYVTNNWANGLDSFTDDSDTTLLDEECLTLGLIWRWKQTKGFDFAADFDKYDKRVISLISRDGTKPILNLSGAPSDVNPVVIVPAGNW